MPSPRPVYSPISSSSGRSTPEAEKEKIGNSRQEIPQLSVGIMASFLDRFNGMSAESLEFSPSQSIWTHSFAEQLAAANRTSFLAGNDLRAPLMSPLTATDRYMTEVNCQRNVGNSDQLVSHSSLVPKSSSVMNNRQDGVIIHNTETEDYLAVQPTIAAVSGLQRAFNVDLLSVDRHSNCEINTKKPLLCNAESLSSLEAVNMKGIISSESHTLTGMIF